MDNLTHSLIGATIGELTYSASSSVNSSSVSSKHLRPLLIWMGVIASNFPDLDTLYTGITPSPLGALLHHRGHTHTILGCVLGLAICLLLLALWPNFRKLLGSDQRALKLTAAVGCLGLTLHIVADALNSYGVHPFYPFNTRWYYGDLIFIIEPFWWVFLGIALLSTSRPKWLWRPLLLVMAIVPVVATYAGYLSVASLSALAVASLLFAFLLRRLGRVRVLQIGVFCLLAYVGVQAFSAFRVRGALTHEYSQDHVRILDIALTPMPANPQCWSALVLMLDTQAQTYAVINESASAFSGLGSALTCPRARPTEVQGRIAVADVRTLFQNDCWFAAWMQFARVPMIEEGVRGAQAVDLRFSRLGRRNFSSLPLIHPQACPRLIPGWSVPRSDLLQ